MKIAFIGHKRMPSREGGVEIVVDELASRMAARGNRVVAYTTGSGHNVAGAEYDGMANGCNKRFAYHDVDVISVPTFEGKGLCRAHLVLLRHVAGHRASRCGALHAEGLFYASCCVSPTGRACALSSPFMDWTGSVPNRADSLRRT